MRKPVGKRSSPGPAPDFGGDPLKILQWAYRNPELSLDLRCRAAVLAIELEREELDPIPAPISPMETLLRFAAGDPAISPAMADAAKAALPYVPG